MATALSMIKRSMRLIGAIDSQETPTDVEAQDALEVLNAMLDEWSNNNLSVYTVGIDTLSWPSGQLSQTIGTGGDFNIDRPIDIQYAWQRIDEVDYPLRVIDDQQFNLNPVKEFSSNLSIALYYEKTFPLGIIHIYPKPGEAQTIKIASMTALSTFASTTTALSMPKGYENAIVYNLALELAPEYQRATPTHLVKRAATALQSIKTTNYRKRELTVETAYFHKSRSGNYAILSGI